MVLVRLFYWIDIEVVKLSLIFAFIFPVPSKNKKDVRTIENIQADIQAKKRLKLAQSSETDNKTDPVAKTD